MTDLIEHIDNLITDCIPTAFAYGLCHLVEDDNGIYPSKLLTEGDKITPNDQYEFQFYHRLLSGSPESDEALSFGRKSTIKNAQQVRTVVFQRMGTDLKFIDDFINSLPDTFNLDVSPPEYKMASVGDSITLNRDSNAIWDDEYGQAYKDKYVKLWNIYAIEWTLNYVKCNVCT